MSIGYNTLEIGGGRRNWIDWLRDFQVGQIEVADLVDRASLSAVISRLHRNNPNVRFTLRKQGKDLLVIRVK